MINAFESASVLAGLRDFQRKTARFVIRRFFDDTSPTRRFLVADPVGTGKTFVARGVIAEAIDRLDEDDRIARIDIVYVCSNADIAAQNVRRLDITGSLARSMSRRLGLLAIHVHDLDRPPIDTKKTINLIAFTPGTSFDLAGQGGIAAERALLHHLLADHYGLDRAERTASKRVFQGTVSSLERFEWTLEDIRRQMDESLDETITRDFLSEVQTSDVGDSYREMVAALRGRRPSDTDRTGYRQLVGLLRNMLARSSIDALEPDLVILDEFQRFKHLLDIRQGGEAAELAHHLFEYPDARVLLLSATPYKMYTLPEEADLGEDHYHDFLDTVRFLADGSSGSLDLDSLTSGLAGLRDALILGVSPLELVAEVSRSLRQVMCRTERPDLDGHGMLSEHLDDTSAVTGRDFVDFAALRRLAHELDAPLTVEYWKSAPYFLNFLDGYQIGLKLREALDDPEQRVELRKIIRMTECLDRSRLHAYAPFDFGNAKLRGLADRTVGAGWWQLLWLPPSLPYYKLEGPWADQPVANGITKAIVFSSWAATPTAVASLLSYEAERLAALDTGIENSPEARRSLGNRLDLRTAAGRPAAMTALALLWPMPELASACDPLVLAKRHPERVPSFGEALEAARTAAKRLIGPDGRSSATAAEAWYWAGPLRVDGTLTRMFNHVDASMLVDALAGSREIDDEDTPDSAGIGAHVERALEVLLGDEDLGTRPAALAATVGLLGLASPGNVAWRALGRLLDGSHKVSSLGHWRAAAVLASAFRTLFNRPDATLVLDRRYGTDIPYWRAVLSYCAEGGLQAVLDEYLHHVAEDLGLGPLDDDALLVLAQKARAAISLRPATYRAFDPDHPHGTGLPFLSRFALRYGTVRQRDEDARLPELRSAFNSPFRPFILATTSIGQEGVDFHWWCHAVVHWNIPPNPVDFEQREGRVNRYKGHAVRRNVAAENRADALRSPAADPWRAAFEAAAARRPAGSNELFPYWVYPGQQTVERHVPLLPLSRDERRYRQVCDALTLYRLAFGQPRQEDLLALLRGRAMDPRSLIDLAPT